MEAEHAIALAIVGMMVDLARLEALPAVVAEMERPAERIRSIRFRQVTCLGGPVGAGGDGSRPVNHVLDPAIGMALQLPAVERPGEELGVPMQGGPTAMLGDAASGAGKSARPHEEEVGVRPRHAAERLAVPGGPRRSGGGSDDRLPAAGGPGRRSAKASGRRLEPVRGSRISPPMSRKPPPAP